MSKEKDSFIVYYEWEDNLRWLTDEQLGQLWRAVFAYEKRGETYSGRDPAVEMAMSFIQMSLDRNRERYKKACERNRRNIEKRWNDTRNTTGNSGIPNDTKNTTGNSGIPNDTKNTEREHEHDHEPERDREHEPEPDHEPEGPSGGSGSFPFAQSDLDLFVEELTGAGIPVDEAGKKLLGEWLQRYDFGFVETAVDEAIHRRARKFRYLEGIVRNWANAGITTGEKAMEYQIKTGAWKGYETG